MITKNLANPHICGAVAITLDDARNLLKKYYVHPAKKASDEKKIASVMKHLSALLYAIRDKNNKLIIIDDDLCDAKHSHAMALLQKHNLPLFLIRLAVDEATAFKRLEKRETERGRQNTTLVWFKDHWKEQWEQYKNFNNHPYDFILDNNEEQKNGPDITPLVHAIKKTLHKTKTA